MSFTFLGSPLIDTTIKITVDFLLKYDLEPDSAYAINEKTKTIFNDVDNSKLECHNALGGSVTNTARVFRKLTENPELDVIYLGAIGNDHHGGQVKKLLHQDNVKTCLIEIANQSTGRVIVLICGTNRSLVTDLGASRMFSVDHLQTAWKTIENSKYFYISAFFIQVSFDVIKKIIEQRRFSLVLNLGAAFLCQKFKRQLSYMYENSEIIFGNEAEHRAFAAIHITSTVNRSVPEIMSDLRAKFPNPKIAVVTRGDRSVFVSSGSGVEEHPVVALETVVDTNGAGDAFAGGFLARYVAGNSVANCVKCGNFAAGVVIRNVGAEFDPAKES